jgi:hypothetical protein
MSFQSPFSPNLNRVSPRSKKSLATPDRSPAANPLRQYGPFVTLAKTLVKFLSLGAVGFGISMVMFAAFDQHTSVTLLVEIGQNTWKPLATLVLCMGMLASIEESFH